MLPSEQTSFTITTPQTGGIRVLSIGFTRNLLVRDSSDGDTTDRLLYYSRRVDAYHVIAHALKKDGLPAADKLAPNFWVYASSGVNVAHSFFRIMQLGWGICRRSKPCVIQAQDPLFTGLAAYLLARLFKLPFNVCIYGTNPFDPHYTNQSKAIKYTNGIAKMVVRAAQGLQTDGKTIAESLVANGIPRQKVFYKPMIPGNIQNFFYNRPQSQALEGTLLPRKLLFVGRLAVQKNLPLLLQALWRVRQLGMAFGLEIVGDGPLRTSLEAQSVALKLTDAVQFVGALPHENIVDKMRAADIFVLSSIYEGFPRVIMEAAACQLPLLCTDVSGVRDVIGDDYQADFIVPINNEDAFAKQLQYALTLPTKVLAAYGASLQQNLKTVVALYDNPEKQVDIWKHLCTNN